MQLFEQRLTVANAGAVELSGEHQLRSWELARQSQRVARSRPRHMAGRLGEVSDGQGGRLHNVIETGDAREQAAEFLSKRDRRVADLFGFIQCA
jgi:hypothetical protein